LSSLSFTVIAGAMIARETVGRLHAEQARRSEAELLRWRCGAS